MEIEQEQVYFLKASELKFFISRLTQIEEQLGKIYDNQIDSIMNSKGVSQHEE